MQKLSTGVSREVFNVPTKVNFDLDSKTLVSHYISHIDAITSTKCIFVFKC